VTKQSDKTTQRKNMSKKTQRIGRRVVQLGWLLAMLFLALQLAPRAPAQRSVGIQSTVGSALQVPAVSSDTNSSAGALPRANCQAGLLSDQYDNPATEPPVGIGSQQFEPAMAAFDSQAADDFVIGGGWGAPGITGVRVMGEYSAGGGPASSFNIYFYQNGAGNLPGTLIAAFMDLPYVETPPDFLICLPYPFGVSPGTYWVSSAGPARFQSEWPVVLAQSDCSI
jgi:hypothetical protein